MRKIAITGIIGLILASCSVQHETTATITGPTDVDTHSGKTANSAPVIATIADFTIFAYEPYERYFTATDANNDDLTWSLQNAPNGAVIDAQSGLFAWEPDPADTGTYDVTLKASDGTAENTQEATITIAFTPPTDTIVLLSPNGGEVYEIGDTIKIKWYLDKTVLSEYLAGPRFRLLLPVQQELHTLVDATDRDNNWDGWNPNSPESCKFGVYEWVIPDSLYGVYSPTGYIDIGVYESDEYYMFTRCEYCDPNTWQDYSDAGFTIRLQSTHVREHHPW
ncbi:MAG: hypothetical protein GF398_07725 [Chitinivibrionales bacterium]|nr:hypothetical protein [Chitinivibrionales bacterium]